MAKIIGAEQMTDDQLIYELQRGGKLVRYYYTISLLVVTFYRTTDVRFIPAGQSPVAPGWPYTLLTLVLGWWGVPWGFIRTPQAIYKNLQGGVDITNEVLAKLGAAPAAQPAMPVAQPAVAVQPATPVAPAYQPPQPAAVDVVLAKRTYQWPDRLGYYATFSCGGQPPVELEVPKDWFDYLQPQMQGRLHAQGNAFMKFDAA